MVIKFEGAIAQLRERLQQIDKKRVAGTEDTKKTTAKAETKSSSNVSDILSVRNENRAAALGNIKNEEEAMGLLSTLQESFTNDVSAALNAHNRADPNKVLKFYPFE